jgi:hypothetical protein
MRVPRAVHTATTLLDGRVLIAGGCTTDGCDLGSPGGATAELFDPRTLSFSPTGPLTISRDDHAAVLLPDGRVLLIGGWGAAGLLASTDLYVPRTGRFTPGPTMHTPRAGFVPIALADGRILLSGGFLGNRPTTAAAELLDPKTLTLAVTGSLTVPRGAYAAARLEDGRVLVAGGLSDGKVVATAELFDPARGTFSPTGSMSIARYKGGALTLPNGDVLVVGGAGDIEGTLLYASTEVYHPASGTFSPGPTMQRARYKLPEALVPLGRGDALVAAGAPEAERFDASAASFVAIPGGLGATRLFLSAAALAGGRALLTGGYDRAIRPTAQAWLYEAP